MSDIVGSYLKSVFLQARPCFELYDYIRVEGVEGYRCASSESGMPSNHAINFFATFSFICFFFRYKTVIIASVALATLVSLSRIYLGMHYPSQVLVGGTIGLILGLSCALLCQHFFGARIKLHEN